MEEKILQHFLYNEKLKFNEIEKVSKLRSNKLSYYIKRLLEEGVITKEQEFYKLSDKSEVLIPYITEKKSILPVVLIAIKESDKIFLHKREKRPYKDKLGLPAGRILLGETISDATKRIMKEKFNIKAKFQKVNSVSVENISKNKQVVHSFLLILVTATTKDKINFVNLKKNKKNMIASDYKLIKEDLNSEIKIRNINSKI